MSNHRGFNPGDRPGTTEIVASSPTVAGYQRKIMAFVTDYNQLCEKFGMQLHMDMIEAGDITITTGADIHIPVATLSASADDGISLPYFVREFHVNEIKRRIDDHV